MKFPDENKNSEIPLNEEGHLLGLSSSRLLYVGCLFHRNLLLKNNNYSFTHLKKGFIGHEQHLNDV